MIQVFNFLISEKFEIQLVNLIFSTQTLKNIFLFLKFQILIK